MESILVAFASDSLGTIAPIMTAISLADGCKNVVCAPQTFPSHKEEYFTFRDAAIATAEQAKQVLERTDAQVSLSVLRARLSICVERRWRYLFETPIVVCCWKQGPLDLYAPNMPDEVTPECNTEATRLTKEWAAKVGDPPDSILYVAAYLHEAAEQYISTLPDTNSTRMH